MDCHVFLVSAVIFCAIIAHGTQSLPFRGRRSPQQLDGNVVLNLERSNLPHLLYNVGKHIHKGIHDVIDGIRNPVDVEIVTEMIPVDVNYQYDYNNQYGFDQEYQDPPLDHQRHHRRRLPHGHRPRDPPYGFPREPPHGPPREPPHGPPRGPPHGPPRGPPHGPPRGPPHGPPRGPPHGPPREPPYDPPREPPHGPPPFDATSHPFYDFSYPEAPDYKSNENTFSFSSPPTTTSINLDEHQKGSNISGYIENNFPVILLTENEIR